MYNTHVATNRDIIKRLQQEGWRVVNAKGSHHQFRHPTRPGRVSVPHPRKDVPRGTIREIFRQAGWKP